MEFKPWQIPIVELLLSDKVTENNPLRAREAWYHTQDAGSEIGRASVILFLQGLEREGLLNKRQRPGRGGYHGVYWMKQGINIEVQPLKGSTKDE